MRIAACDCYLSILIHTKNPHTHKHSAHSFCLFALRTVYLMIQNTVQNFLPKVKGLLRPVLRWVTVRLATFSFKAPKQHTRTPAQAFTKSCMSRSLSKDHSKSILLSTFLNHAVGQELREKPLYLGSFVANKLSTGRMSHTHTDKHPRALAHQLSF